MSRVLTLKVTPSLMHRLEKKCAQEGRSKGAVVREAIENHLESAATESNGPSVEKITEAMMRGKTFRLKADWAELRRKAREGAPNDMTPEEEVRFHRSRGLLP
jgi:hypothetical protein